MPQAADSATKKWFAFYTKSRQEFKAKTELDAKYIENYLPTITTIKKWSDRKKKVTEPVFRGYIFVFVNEKERLTAMQNGSIVRTICFEGKPAVIPDWQIENLRIMLSESPEVFITNKIEVGEKIKITSGPFDGVVGVVQEVDREKWLAISVELLNRSILVKLPKESVLKFIDN